jgi:putative SOS response-associated peptidase YedK
MINARAETVTTKPAFRDALKKRRCLISADGFYEWQKAGKVKVPYCFTMQDGSIFGFAGLWDAWRDGEGREIETCSIITTTPNSLLEGIHDRMPVILPDDGYDLWRRGGMRPAPALRRPFDAPVRGQHAGRPRQER